MEIVTKFNEYFNTIPTSLRDRINTNNDISYDEFLRDLIPESQPFDEVTDTEIMSIIKNLKDSPSAGYDSITT